MQNWEDNQAELPKEKEWVQRHGNMVSSQKINAEYKSKNPRMSHSTAQCMFKSSKPGWVNNIETYHRTERPWMLYFYPTKHTPIYDNSVERKKLYESQADAQPYGMLFLQYYSTLILIIYITFESVPTKPHIG